MLCSRMSRVKVVDRVVVAALMRDTDHRTLGSQAPPKSFSSGMADGTTESARVSQPYDVYCYRKQ
jgi:hypothetical protein